MMHAKHGVRLVLALGCAVSAAGQQGMSHHQAQPANRALQQKLQAMSAEPAVARAHWGIVVERMDGTVEAALNAGEFFQPASNAKLFTTAAAMALLPMDRRLTTQVLADGVIGADGVYRGNLVLVGAGDANFSGRPVPYRVTPQEEATPPRDELRYIRELASSVKAAGVTRVEGDVIGDDTLFPWDPYPQDWAWDDLQWYYGAPVTSLMVADNSLTLTVTPGAVGQPATVSIDPALPYYTLDAHAVTGTETALKIDRPIGSKVVTVTGTIAAGAKRYEQGLSIEDPATYAASAFKAALEADGLMVTGAVTSKHLPLLELDFERAAGTPLALGAGVVNLPAPAKACALSMGHTAPQPACAVAQHIGLPLYEDVVVTNKVSQNQHAEMFLRLLGLAQTGSGTTAQGARVVRAFLTQQAGVDGGDFVFVDGSGLSGHDLVTPRAAATLLRYAAGQPWGEKWKASLPVGGVDGSLRSRFAGEMKGRVFAKTGTLGEARALSGYLTGKSGSTVVFSVMVTGHTPLNRTDEAVMDRMVLSIADAE